MDNITVYKMVMILLPRIAKILTAAKLLSPFRTFAVFDASLSR